MTFAALKRFVQPGRPITYGIVQAGPEDPEGVRYIRPVDMTSHDGCRSVEELPKTSAAVAAQYKRSAVAPGDIVVSIGPSYGKTMIVPAELDGANLTQGTARVAVSKHHDSRFVRWCMQAGPTIAHWDAAVGGATFRALNLAPLAETPIPLLPRDRQAAIADYLDIETVRIDALLSKKQRMIELSNSRWRRQLLDEVAPHLAGAPLPEGWAQGRLRNFVDRVVGGSWGTEPGEASVDAPCVRAADFNFPRLSAEDGAIRSYGLSEMQSRVVRPGDLVIEKSGGGDETPVGRVVMWLGENNAVPTNFAARLRTSDRVDPWFSLLAFRAAYEAGLNWRSIKQTTGIQNLDTSAYLSESWPIPPIEDQRRIAAGLRARLDSTMTLCDALQSQIRLLREHRQALITAAVTGELSIPGVAA